MKHICLFLFGALLAMGIPIGGAVTRDFTIDPTQSSVALSGDVAGITFKEQAPGSLSTSYSGTITLGLTDATVQITAGTMNAAVSGDWLPGPNGQGGAAPADGSGCSFDPIWGYLSDFVCSRGPERGLRQSADVVAAAGNDEVADVVFRQH